MAAAAAVVAVAEPYPSPYNGKAEFKRAPTEFEATIRSAIEATIDELFNAKGRIYCNTPGCGRLLTVYPRFCLEHNPEGTNVFIAQSIMPQADYGLFAHALIPCGDSIDIYNGVVTQLPAKNGDYVLTVTNHHYSHESYSYNIDGTAFDASMARCINNNPPLLEANCMFRRYHSRAGVMVVAIEAVRDIQPGEELIVDYGEKWATEHIDWGDGAVKLYERITEPVIFNPIYDRIGVPDILSNTHSLVMGDASRDAWFVEMRAVGPLEHFPPGLLPLIMDYTIFYRPTTPIRYCDDCGMSVVAPDSLTQCQECIDTFRAIAGYAGPIRIADLPVAKRQKTLASTTAATITSSCFGCSLVLPLRDKGCCDACYDMLYS